MTVQLFWGPTILNPKDLSRLIVGLEILKKVSLSRVCEKLLSKPQKLWAHYIKFFLRFITMA